MTDTMRIVLFLVILPLGLTAATRLATWRLYRTACLAALVLWLGGLAAASHVQTSCDGGNLLYGYSGCGEMPRWVRLNLPAYGVFAMLAALALFVAMTLALGVRSLLRRR